MVVRVACATCHSALSFKVVLPWYIVLVETLVFFMFSVFIINLYCHLSVPSPSPLSRPDIFTNSKQHEHDRTSVIASQHRCTVNKSVTLEKRKNRGGVLRGIRNARGHLLSLPSSRGTVEPLWTKAREED